MTARPKAADEHPAAPRRFLRLDNLANELGVHRVTVWKWVQAGSLPAPVRIGRTPFWHRDVIDVHLATTSKRGALGERRYRQKD